MKLVAITQRVTVVPRYQERRDCLDQNWARFMAGWAPGGTGSESSGHGHRVL
jgi:hypothetical protein